MKKKFLVFALLLSIGFAFGSSCPVLAEECKTEDLKYMEYIDNNFVISKPAFQIAFTGTPVTNKYFLNMPIGDVISYEYCFISDFIFSTNLDVKNIGKFDVGFNLSEMFLRIDVDFLIRDVNGNFSTENIYFDVPVSDFYKAGDKTFKYSLSYDSILNLVDSYYYVGVDTVSYTIYSDSLNRCGSTYQYKITYTDNNYASCFLEGVEQFFYNSSVGTVFLSNTCDSGYVKELKTYHCSITTISPDDVVISGTVATLDFLEEFIVGLPEMLKFVLNFCVSVLNMLPDFILVCLPFIPNYIVYAFVYVMYFGIVVGVWKLLRG